MSVKLRLARGGSKKKPVYSIIASDKKSPRDGRFIEKLGTYDPHSELSGIKINADRVKYWYGVGAEVSDQVANLFKIEKIELVRGKTHKAK